MSGLTFQLRAFRIFSIPVQCLELMVVPEGMNSKCTTLQTSQKTEIMTLAADGAVLSFFHGGKPF
jgi:hypothetical protein